ncbi:YDG domain-containing protein [Halarcobacter sp.]|uniref:YDG domain-containing protein n=1 Tax=Halarcobacter sp. TaxID=2321133 RepID=UPI002AAA64D8|nr:YDG domain-containing protein [Halarcobacter sp.]
MKKRFDHSSQFRILKGGKISLVVSALVTSVTLSFAAPSGGVVTSGSATISQNANITNINQASQKASINWNTFSINKNETVNFNQPNSSSITLNRVIGNERSIINGALNANGQVWILNSNGVLFGKNASINTSGLLATTASLSDENFQSGNYNFKNSTSNAIINEGAITVNNASYVIFASNETRNSGSIEAVKGSIQLVGANEYSINLSGNSLVSLTVDKGVLDALVENSGTVIANGGEVYLTTNAVDELLGGVVNHTGIIEANSLEGITGKVELFAHGGTTSVDGTIKAKEGVVETSGEKLNISQETIIEADTWLLDPTNIVIESSGGTDLTGSSVSATAIENALSGTTNIVLSADEDITVGENITWSTSNQLTLTAGDEIYVNATIENTNSVNGGVYFNASNTTDKVIFGTNGKVIINNIYQLQWVNQALNGTYELGSDVDASATSTWNSDGSDGYYGFDPIGYNNSYSDKLPFQGRFNGNNHAIDSLYINRSSERSIGLFGHTAIATISNLGVTNVDITGNRYVGALVGYQILGTIKKSYVTGSVNGHEYTGGLVGYNSGDIYESYASVNVSATYRVGGLVGSHNNRIISNSYAIGKVSGAVRGDAGGLAGETSDGIIQNCYAIVDVSENTYSKALIGSSDRTKVYDSYWNKEISGHTSGGSQTGTGLTTEQFDNPTFFSSWSTNLWKFEENQIDGYGIFVRPYLKNVTQESDIPSYTTLFASGLGTEASPYTISTWVQLANINYNNNTLSNNYYYSLSNNLTTSNSGYITYASSSANSGKGWDSIGNDTDYFTGTFDGNNYTIDSLYINRSSEDYIGLFGYTDSATISNLGVTNVDITGNDSVGALVGYNNAEITNSYVSGSVSSEGNSVGGLVGSNIGTIRNSYATGSVSGNDDSVGGLVGYNDGTIRNSYATGAVSGDNWDVGGLVGYNGGTITNSYATGSVSGNISVGGLVGYNYGTITNSYWDTETSGQSSSIGGTGLTSAQMGYGKIFSDSSWNIEIDHTLTSGHAPVLRYNADGSATWIIAPLKLSYSLGDQTLTYNGTQDLSSFYDSSSIFGSDYSFIDSSDYSFIDGSDSTITSVRNAGTYRVGLKNENSFLSMASTGYTKATITINKKEITATYSAEDKTYDGTTTATVSGSLGGVISGDKVSLLNQSASFEDKNAGENKQVNITNIALSGDDASNYVVSDTTTNATINKKGITATYTAEDKIYDGTTLANVNGSLVDAINGDSISLIQRANFEDKNAGENKQVNITNIALSGNDASNYTLTSPTTATTSANINKKGITATYTADDKTYDGTTLANVNGSLNDAISGDNISLIQSADFEDKNAGTNKKINITNIALSGNDASNYTLTSPTTATTSANINKKGITAAYTADDKTYDGTTTAIVSGSLDGGIISGDSVSLLNQSANFEDKNAGSNKQVNITNIALSGDDASNYVVSDTTTNATINKKGITATYSAEDKIYDGTTLANVNGSLVDAINGDSISLIQRANFEDKNAGENKQVNITNIALSGDDALNYTLTSPTTATTNANINKKEIKATYSAEDKTYDGTTTATVSGSIEGILKGDKVSFISGEGYFKDSIPGINKTVYIEGFRLEGKDSKNYVLDADSYTTIASININIDLEDIIASIRKEEEYKIKNHFIHFNPIRKEIVLEIINEGIKFSKTEMTQSLFFNDSDNKGDEI